MTNNFIVCPAYYRNTSFDEIVRRIAFCVKEQKLQVRMLGLKTPLQNNLMSDTLDDNEFFHFQNVAISECLNEIQNDSKLLFLDFFFPGIDIVKYYLSKNNISNTKLGALLHGGAFLEDDIHSDLNWLQKFELGYFEAFDVIYSPSDFLKSSSPVIYGSKIVVREWGLDGLKIPDTQTARSIDVIFPHRLSVDKGIDDFIDLVNIHQDAKFCLCVPQSSEQFIAPSYRQKLLEATNLTIVYNENEEDHLKTLASAKIVLSCSRQENFGYSVHKAVQVGCVPILPNKLCYPEFFKEEFMYRTFDDASRLIKFWVNNFDTYISQSAKKTPREFSFNGLLNHFFNE